MPQTRNARIFSVVAVLSCFMVFVHALAIHRQAALNQRFHRVVMWEWFDQADAMLKRGADINARHRWGHTTLYWSLAQNRLDSAEYVLKRGANSDLDSAKSNPGGLTLLMLDCGAIDRDALERRVNYGRPPKWYGEDQLDIAARLLNSGQLLEARDAEGRTAMSYASTEASIAMVQFLVKRGADVNTRDKRGATPILLAAEAGRLGMVTKLIGFGARLDLGSENEGTPLQAALRERRWDIVLVIAEAANKG